MTEEQFEALAAWFESVAIMPPADVDPEKRYEDAKQRAREAFCGSTAKPSGCERVGTNSGHGHAWQRPDGVRARCGGPAVCGQCAMDKSLADRCAEHGR